MKTKELGWICKHPQYGTWFISRQAVINDWKIIDNITVVKENQLKRI